MSTLIVVAYEDRYTADEVLMKLHRLEKEYLIDLEDAAVVIRKKDGKVKVKQTYNLVAAGAAGGGFWGLLIGALFLHPLVGFLVGVGTGALTGALYDVGINDDFIKELGSTIKPDSSALFILVRKFTPDKVIDSLKSFGGTILKTSLSRESEEILRKALKQE